MHVRTSVVALVAGTALLLGACGSDKKATPATTPPATTPASSPIGSSPVSTPMSSPVTSPVTTPVSTPVTAGPSTTEAATTTTVPVPIAALALGTVKGNQVLVDDKGLTLYLNKKDTQGSASNCNSPCSLAWVPLITSGAPTATGLDATKLGTITRTDGTTQVTYNGWPLYHHAGDANPGDATGEKVNGQWFTVSATGDPV